MITVEWTTMIILVILVIQIFTPSLLLPERVCSNWIGNWILIRRSSRYKYSFVRTLRLNSNSCCRNNEVSKQRVSRILMTLDDACKNKLAVNVCIYSFHEVGNWILVSNIHYKFVVTAMYACTKSNSVGNWILIIYQWSGSWLTSSWRCTHYWLYKFAVTRTCIPCTNQVGSWILIPCDPGESNMTSLHLAHVTCARCVSYESMSEVTVGRSSSILLNMRIRDGA